MIAGLMCAPLMAPTVYTASMMATPQTIATCQSPLCAPVSTEAWTAPHPNRISM